MRRLRLGTAIRALGSVGVAVLVSSALGYALLIGYGRVLAASPAELEIFMVFWSVLLGIGAALGPLEQDVARQSAQAAVAGGRPGAAVYQVTAVGVAVVALAGMLAAIPPVPARLFEHHPGLLVVAVAGGLACSGYLTVRGLLLGTHRIALYSGLLIAENAIRLALIGGLVVAGMAGVLPLAVSAAAGFLIWLVLAPSARALVDSAGPAEPWAAVIRRVLALVAAAGLMASVLTGFPAMVGVLAPADGSGQLAALYLALPVARIPLLFLAPVQTLTVPVVVRLSQDEQGRRRLRKILVGLVFGTLLVGALGAAIGAVAGPAAVQLLFGSEYRIGHLAMAALVWSSVALGAVLLLSAVLVARTMANRVMVTWAVIAGMSVLALLWGPGDAVQRAVVGIAVAPTVGLAIASVSVLGRSPTRRAVPSRN